MRLILMRGLSQLGVTLFIPGVCECVGVFGAECALTSSFAPHTNAHTCVIVIHVCSRASRHMRAYVRVCVCAHIAQPEAYFSVAYRIEF